MLQLFGGLHRAVQAGVAGDDDHLQARRDELGLVQQFQAVQVGHAKIA